MLNCKEITELASKRLENQIPWYRKMEFSAHLMMCKRCHLYFKQLKFLQKAFAQQTSEQAKTVLLSDDARQRIKKKLEEIQS